MSEPHLSLSRRDVLVAAAAAGAATVMPMPLSAAAGDIRPFHVSFPDEALADLRRRIAATKWPTQERSRMRRRACNSRRCESSRDYWANEHDWRKVEARLNALPQFMTEIDGLDIHFIHVRSKHANALPVIITHGWPGSVIEQLKVIGPLTDPDRPWRQRGGRVRRGDPVAAGPRLLGQADHAPAGIPIRIARAWTMLMKRLGYTRYRRPGRRLGQCRHGADGAAGAAGAARHSHQHAGDRSGRHRQGTRAGGPAPAGLSADEQHAYDQLDFFYKHGLGYAQEMANRPQTLYALADSPVGLAAWMLDHDARSYALIARVFDGEPEGLTRDDILDNITLYWLTNTAVSSARLYWESKLAFFAPEGRRHPGGRERLSGRDLRGAAELGRAGLSQAHPLQPARPRAATSPPGSSRTSSPPSCARRSSSAAGLSGACSPSTEILVINQQDKLLYTAKVHTAGGREGGTSRSSDGNLDIRISRARQPWCWHEPRATVARRLVRRASKAQSASPRARRRSPFRPDFAIDAEVDLSLVKGFYTLSARLNVSLPGLAQRCRPSAGRRAPIPCAHTQGRPTTISTSRPPWPSSTLSGHQPRSMTMKSIAITEPIDVDRRRFVGAAAMIAAAAGLGIVRRAKRSAAQQGAAASLRPAEADRCRRR